MSTQYTATQYASTATQGNIKGFILGLAAGLVLVIVGVLVVIQSLPGTDPETFLPTGSMTGLLIGALLIGVGQMVFLIYTIATGVFLGTKAARPLHR